MTETVFTNVRLVLDRDVVSGSIAIRDGLIAAIDSGPARGEDMGGDYLLPGLVELHTDHVESHYAPRPGVTWEALAAVQAHDLQIAGSGITTVFDALRVGTDEGDRVNVSAMLDLADAVDIGRRDERFRADHRIHLRCEASSPDMLAGFEAFLARIPLGLVSVMDHAPGQRQFASMTAYRAYYQGVTGMSETAFELFVERRVSEADRHSAANRLAIFAACRDRGIVVASHDDSTVEHVAEAIAGGVAIAEFPTTREAAGAAHDGGLKVLMGAPNLMRGGSHSGNVSTQELAETGTLDILSSDYVPSSLLAAMFRLPRLVPGVTLPDAVRSVTSVPAGVVGLADRGAIRPGLRADLVRARATAEGPPVVAGVWREGRRVA
jgi:alpha-D-ribose 1-methylphosphonate 5-triphosphate diphosphatase